MDPRYRSIVNRLYEKYEAEVTDLLKEQAPELGPQRLTEAEGEEVGASQPQATKSSESPAPEEARRPIDQQLDAHARQYPHQRLMYQRARRLKEQACHELQQKYADQVGVSLHLSSGAAAERHAAGADAAAGEEEEVRIPDQLCDGKIEDYLTVLRSIRGVEDVEVPMAVERARAQLKLDPVRKEMRRVQADSVRQLLKQTKDEVALSGGACGDAYYQQRMNILHEMEAKLATEKVQVIVADMYPTSLRV